MVLEASEIVSLVVRAEEHTACKFVKKSTTLLRGTLIGVLTDLQKGRFYREKEWQGDQMGWHDRVEITDHRNMQKDWRGNVNIGVH